MIFKPDGSLIFEGADRVVLTAVYGLKHGDWVKAVDFQFQRFNKKTSKKAWSHDCIRFLALYGLKTYNKKKGFKLNFADYSV